MIIKDRITILYQLLHKFKVSYMSTKDNIFIGIDVSKESLDIAINSKHFKIKNNSKEISKFIKLNILECRDKIKLCVLESTGGYEKLVMKLLQQIGIPVHRAHPNKVYAFAKVKGHFAKTDKLDSALLEQYAAFVACSEQGDVLLTDVQEELKSLKAIEVELQANIQANKNRLHHVEGKALSYLKRQINFCQKQLEQIRADIDSLIEQDDDLSKKQAIITSYKGVGKRTASVLLIQLPELGKLSNKEIASLVGLAPKTNESGKKVFKAHISGGRFVVRHALYMAALVAARYNQHIRVFYDRLLLAGKAPKVALVAVMRKIIICLNSMLKNNQLFT